MYWSGRDLTPAGKEERSRSRRRSRGSSTSSPQESKSLQRKGTDPSSLFFMSSSGGLRFEVISQSPQKGPRTPFRCLRLMLVGAERPASAFLNVQLRRVEARGHKAKKPKRPRTPFRLLRLMLVASERAASAFLHVQLRRVEARGHKAKKPKRPRTPFRLLRLMLVASERPASAFLGIFLLYNGRLMGRVFFGIV